MYNEQEEVELKRPDLTVNQSYIPKGLVNAYVDNRLTQEQKKQFEMSWGNDPVVIEQVRIKKEIKSFINDQIPEIHMNAKLLRDTKREMADIADSILGEDKVNLVQKISKFLDKTIIEF
jgi:adenylate kinase family enzyme